MVKNVKIIWDMVLTTDRAVGANRPNIVVRDKKNKRVLILDVSCPSDVNVVAKENEKINKYSPLRVELSKMWNSECDVIPVVVGGLGCVSKNFEGYLKRIPAELSKELCIEITLLGSEKLMRSFLSRK